MPSMNLILMLLFMVIGAVLFLAGWDFGYRQGEKDASYNINKILKMTEKG